MGELHHTTMSRFLISFALIAIAVTAVPTPMDAVVPEQDLVEHGPFDKCMNGCFGKRAANREACTEGCHGVCEKSHEPNKKGDEEQHEQAMGMMNKLIGECGKACDGAKECMAKKEKGGKPGPKCQKVKENCMPCIHSKMPKGPGMKPETLLETLLQQPGNKCMECHKGCNEAANEAEREWSKNASKEQHQALHKCIQGCGKPPHQQGPCKK